MKLKFIFRRIPTKDHDTWGQFKKWRIPVTRYNELRNLNLTVHTKMSVKEEDLVADTVLFFEKGSHSPLNVNWGWREYKLKKL